MKTVKKNFLILPLLSVMALFVSCTITPDKGLGIDMSAFLASDHKDHIYIPIVVVGSGPAGSSVAIYGARSMMTTVVFQGPKPGGLLTDTSDVENWPGVAKQRGGEIMESLKKQAEHFGAIFIDDAIVDIDLSQWPYKIKTEGEKTYYAFALVIATGASPTLLKIPGEAEYFGRGVGTCAICDAPLYKDKEVIVIGGGDSAVEEAIQISAYAKKVTVIVRKEKMRAAESMQKMLKGYPNISTIFNTEVDKVNGDGDVVTSVTLRNNKTGEITDFRVDGVFLAIGHEPNTKLFKGKVAMDDHGYITLKDRTQITSVPGVFAAGDCQDSRYRQAVTSSGYGAAAGLDAVNFLKEIGFNSQVQPLLIDHIFVAEEKEHDEE